MVFCLTQDHCHKLYIIPTCHSHAHTIVLLTSLVSLYIVFSRLAVNHATSNVTPPHDSWIPLLYTWYHPTCTHIPCILPGAYLLSFPSLVLSTYTTSDTCVFLYYKWQKLGGHGCLGTRLCSNYEVILHICTCMYLSLSIYTWAQFPGYSLRTCIDRCMVNLASFSCSPYTKLTGMGLGMRLWLSTFSLMHIIIQVCCQFN